MSVGDAVLWERWQGRRDADAFAELVARHSSMVYATCRRVLGDATKAEDAAQDCFLELMDAQLRVKESVAPWLHTVAVRRCIDMGRSDARRRRRHERLEQPVSTTADLPEAELLAMVDEAIAELPDRFRLPIVFRFLEGQTHAAIAERLGLSEASVRYRIERGVERLRAILRRRGVTRDTVHVSAVLLGLPAFPAPAAMIARLGRHALSHTAPVGATSLAGATQLMGGLLMMKKILAVVALVVALAAVSWWGLKSASSVAPAQNPPVTIAADAPPPSASGPERPPSAKESGSMPEAVPAKSEPAPAADAATEEGIPVQGIVLDRNDQPVPDADIGGKFRDPRPDQTNSAADGTFRLHFVAATNDLVLMARKDGYQSELAGPLKLRNEGLSGVVLRLTVPCTGSISGTLTDLAGKPVSGQLLWFDPGRARYLMPKATVTTDAKGAFSVEDLAPGRYGIVPVSGVDSGFLTTPLVSVELKSGQTVRNLHVVYDGGGGNAIAGRVTSRTGQPIADAVVSCHHPFNGWAKSDAEGRFRITGLPSGQCGVTAQHEEHALAVVQNVSSGTEDLEIVMSDFGAVEGRVLEAGTQTPITRFQIFRAEGNATEIDAVQYSRRAGFDDAEGRFSLPDVSPGTVRITVLAEGFAPTSQTAEVLEGQTQSLEFALESGKKIEGQVVDSAGRAVSGVNIYLGPVPLDMGSLGYFATQSDSSGNFVIEHAPRDQKVLGALHPDYASLNVNAEDHVRIVLRQSGTLEGVVTENGNPASSLPVFAVAENTSAAAPCRTEADGSYRITGLPPGPITVVAVSPSDKRRVMRQAIVQEGASTTLDLSFDHGESTIEGRLTYTGRPSAEGYVSLLGPSGEVLAATKANAEGVFRFEKVAAGPAKVYGVVGGDEAGFSKTVEVDVPEGETVRVDIDVAPTADTRLTGSVSGSPSGGMVQAFVLRGAYALPAPEEWQKAVMELTQQAAALALVKNGVFEIEGLDPAEYTVVAVFLPQSGPRTDLRLAAAPVTLQDSNPVSVQLDLSGN